ncbi:MAG: cold shock domain-containing protein [Bacteroidales bacterium]
MAKRVTSEKREREKIKQSKRQEKQKKKEERQTNSVRTFDEMLAYVDENGVLHSTPQDIRPKKEVDATEILVSVPKKSDMDKDVPFMGAVEHYDSQKGYGFIKNTENGEKYFFHISNAPAEIIEGDKVSFEIESGPRGMNAVRISIIK